MKIRRFGNSLFTRLVLFGIGIVISTAILRFYFLRDFLETEQSAVVARQQSIIASYLAQDIGYRTEERRHFLERLATQVPPGLLNDPAALREWLREHQELQPLFAQGLFFANTDGVIVVDYPTMNGRRAISLTSYPDYTRVLDGATVIGDPLLSPASARPILPMMAPVRNAEGRISGILGGTTELNATGFLDHLQRAQLGPSGGFMLISPSRRLIIASSNPASVFNSLPPTGTDLLLDRALTGFRGNGVGRDQHGVDEIKAFASVPGTDWIVVACLPLAAAVPTAAHMRELITRGAMMQGGVIFVIIVLAYLWFFRRLRRAADLADKMTRGEIPLSPLPVVRRDEVGHLTMAFNGLLARLKMHQSELQHQAHHDVLTGLPNRIMLAERMQQALARAGRENTGIALLYLDLDGFKPINDTLGHQAGDLVLKEIAQRLRQVARHSDTLARVGGDEFVLLATDLGQPLENGTRALAEKCIKAVSEPLRLAHGDRQLGVSIGIAVCDGRCDADALLQAADKAMYHAKAQGRGRYVIAANGIGCGHSSIVAGATTEAAPQPHHPLPGSPLPGGTSPGSGLSPGH
ncbi:GGDEF domain-containing protein [Herbaspirillum lusitanum]|uniref:GGDEF domain-containing protein n=1 Tax=Herbaspirillum lusitanum TaxID=213312 RepID=A0ABW9AAN4_9BURK